MIGCPAPSIASGASPTAVDLDIGQRKVTVPLEVRRPIPPANEAQRPVPAAAANFTQQTAGHR